MSCIKDTNEPNMNYNKKARQCNADGLFLFCVTNIFSPVFTWPKMCFNNRLVIVEYFSLSLEHLWKCFMQARLNNILSERAHFAAVKIGYISACKRVGFFVGRHDEKKEKFFAKNQRILHVTCQLLFSYVSGYCTLRLVTCEATRMVILLTH